MIARTGAVAADGLDAGVAAHYGEPVAEQRRLVAGEALVDLSNRGVVTVAGPDRLSWLHSLTTQQLTGLAPGVSTETLLLSPKGHLENAMRVLDDGERVWLTTEPGMTGPLVDFLDRMRFMLRVEVAEVSDAYAVLGHTGDAPAGAVLTWQDPWPGLVGDTAAYGPVEGHPAIGRVWRESIVPRDGLSDAVAGRSLAGSWAAEALRVAAWRPRFGAETDHRTIAHELDWLRTAVHLHKGCYRGQETIARVHNLGRPPRRLAFVHLDGSGHELPAVGADVLVPGAASERPVGRLTSVARHHEDGPIGLVVIKRNTPADVDLLVDGVAAAQTVIVEP